MKQTSANMQPCRGESAERHNRRDKDLDYIRQDLTKHNSYKLWTTIADQMQKIREEYEKATGQKLQSTAQPIQEIVLVIDMDTTAKQVEDFCDKLKTMGMTPLSYAIHKDEGHYDKETGEWVPNYHAHIIVDTTCWEHKMVERTKKKNGKNVINPKTKKPEKIKVDAYAKTIKFTREDMSRLQDFAAEATGLERGVASDKVHEEARRFKAKAQAKEIMEQAETIEGQKALIAEQEQTIRACVVEMQEQGKSVVKNFDEQTGNLQKNGLELDKALIERRNWLETASNDDIEQKAPVAVLQMLRPISDAITVVAMAAAAMASAIADSVSRSVLEKQKMLTALTRQIKEQSIWKSTKGAILSLVNKPANRQVENLQEELREVRAEAEVAKATFEKQNAVIAESLRAEEAKSYSLLIRLKDAERRNKALQEALNKEETTNAALREELRTEKDAHKMTIQEKESLSLWVKGYVEKMDKRLRAIAISLVDYASSELRQRYESRGLPRFIGEQLWASVVDTKEERAAKRAALQKEAEMAQKPATLAKKPTTTTENKPKNGLKL